MLIRLKRELIGPLQTPTTGLLLTNAEIKFCNTGVKTSGQVEGFYMSGFEVVLCGTSTTPSIDLSASGSLQGPAFHLVNGHVDAIGDGVHMTNLSTIHVHNVDFSHVSPAAISGTLLYLLNCLDATITDCMFASQVNKIADENGIFLTSTARTTISGNHFVTMQPTASGSCIVAYTGSTTVRVTNNIFSNVRNATDNHIGSQFYYDTDNIVE